MIPDRYRGPSRRSLVAGALAGAGFAAPLATVAAPTATTGNGTIFDPRAFGARGDGKADDTRALQAAIDAAGAARGSVFVPPGNYRTGELQLRRNVALTGVAGWDYHHGGGSVLTLADPSASCLLNLTGTHGVTLDGLSLEGGELGRGVHGIFLNKPRADDGGEEDALRIERCSVLRFSGDAVNLIWAWAFSVRHCMLAYAHGDGLRLRGWDGFILDNWLSGNRGAGFGARQENAAITFTANRVEWNGAENMRIDGGLLYTIAGNYFDRAGHAGIAIGARGNERSSHISIVGNTVYRSGKMLPPAVRESAQIRLENADGVICSANIMRSGVDDTGAGPTSPAYGIVCAGLANSAIKDNVLHEGFTRALILDEGGHRGEVVIKDNIGSVG